MLKDLLKQSRSYRGYDKSRKLTREELAEFVDCARYAPSSVNVQPFRYYLAWEDRVVERLLPLTKWARALQPMRLPHPGHEPAAFIVICQDTQIHTSLPRFQKDVGIVAQTILLAAAEKGLGGCMIGNYSAEEVANALELADHLVPVLLVALGKPDEKIVLTELREGENANYYRDENDVHYVPKRRLEDVILP